jgi:hypothetical protein
MSALGLAGLATGFAGVLLIMGGRIGGGVDLVGLGLCLGGVLALAVATRMLRGATAGGGLLMAVGLQMLVGAATLLPIGFLFESVGDVRPTLALGLAFAYTTVMPGLVATLIWFALVNRIGATAASSVPLSQSRPRRRLRGADRGRARGLGRRAGRRDRHCRHRRGADGAAAGRLADYGLIQSAADRPGRAQASTPCQHVRRTVTQLRIV